MTVEPTGRGDVRASIFGGQQDAVVTARDITGPVTITSSGTRVPGYLQEPGRWPLVETWDALAAGTHRSRPSGAGDAVPSYVDRDIDTVLQTRLAQATEQGGLVLVVGESATGKTRTAHQAVRRCEKLAGYRVLAPDTGTDLVIAVEVLAAARSRCVLWLDDLERFLGPDGLQPGMLAEVVRLRVPVLATMQLRHYDALYSPAADLQPHSSSSAGPAPATAARILNQTELFHLQRRWSTAELERAKTSDDTRITDALRQHGDYGIAEYLAAGPALQFYRQALDAG
ncbi:hypothetical protein ACFW7K_12640, partial [Streptomyces sp. NPDC058735]